jgi:biopolymer transport protein ExbD
MILRSKRQKRRRLTTNFEISLTPLIDTALTLLVIFMITTPIIQNAIRVNLPAGEVKEGGTQAPELIVAIDNSGVIYFNNKKTSLDQLGKAIKQQVGNQQDKSVWVHVDEINSCKTLFAIINSIKVTGGVKDVKMVQRMVAKAAT